MKLKTLPPGTGGRTFGCQLRVLGQDSFKNYDVELDILCSGPVQHGTWEFRNLEQYAHTFCGTPILCAYVGERIGDGHNLRNKRGPNGEAYASFMGPTAERIVGAISENPEDLRVETRQGIQWIVARGKLWRFYAMELVDKIARQGRMDLSAETNVTEKTDEGKREIFEAWYGLGVTILGDAVVPAAPNAHIRALQALETEFKAAQLRAASLQKPDRSQKRPRKGVNQMNKRLLAQLQALFPEYAVLACSEDQNHVVLMAKKDGAICTYQFAADEARDSIVPNRIRLAAMSANFTFDDGTETSVDATAIFASLSEQLTNANTALETVRADLDSSRETIRAMETRETARRALAAESAVKVKLAQVNANRPEGEKIEASVADTILEECKAGKFNTCADDSGAWTGEHEAELRLMAAVGEFQAGLDAKKAKEKPVYAWDVKACSAGENGIESALNRING